MMPSNQAGMLDKNLRDYEQDKFAIAAILRSASSATSRDGEDLSKRAQELFARLAEDRFNLICVGRFSRGKTSLMNAILGTDRLPTGIVPLTSVITTVAYGSEERVVLKYDGRILAREVPLEALPQYITQQGNPGNIRRIKTVEVQLPADILRRGFHFIDTPGLGSPIPESTRTTQAFLPEGDAFLLVTSYESPLSEEEMRVVRTAASSGRRIFVVLNKHDTVSLEDRNDALTYVRKQLDVQFGGPTRHIFSVSARDGLDAKKSRDPQRLVGSGITTLEEELVRFLLSDKRTEFLLRMCDRVSGLVRELPASAETSRLSEQINALAKRIVQDHPDAAIGAPSCAVSASTLDGLQRFRPCEVCAYAIEAQWDFLCRYQYDLSVDHEEQQRFAERGGFCSFHTWQYGSLASSRGMCISYPPLLDQLVAQLHQAPSTEVNKALVLPDMKAVLPAPESCTLCEVSAKAESETLAAIRSRLTENEEALQSLSAICLPHLRSLCAALQDPDVIGRLMKRHAMVVERLSEDMQRYVLKHDAVRRHLESEEEEEAAERALLLLAGHRNINFARTPN